MKINYLCSFIFTWGLKYFLTVENQLIISIIQYLGRPPTRKNPIRLQICSFVPDLPPGCTPTDVGTALEASRDRLFRGI